MGTDHCDSQRRADALSAPESRQEARELAALAGADRGRAEERFGSLSSEARLDVVLAAESADRIDLLLLAEEPTELIRAIPGRDLYTSVQTVGKWESQEIIELASEEQLTFMLDHGCWRGERLDSRSTMDWLRLFMSSEDGQLLRLLTSISADLLAFILKKHVRFSHDIMINDTYYCDPDWVRGSNATVTEFLARLYALDPNLWIRLMGWVRTHSKPTIEADALQAREARMQGKGFPPHSLAITVYYPVDYDVTGLISGWETEFNDAVSSVNDEEGALPAGPARPTLFFEEVVRRSRAAEAHDEFLQARLESQLIDIANKVMVADQVDMGDARRQREAIDKVRRWTNVGLEIASSGSIPAGVSLLSERELEHCFRLGGMLFDALASGVVELEKAEKRIRGRLAEANLLPVYLALAQPEPRIPSNGAPGHGQSITSRAEYRYAWQLVWYLSALFLSPPQADSERL